MDSIIVIMVIYAALMFFIVAVRKKGNSGNLYSGRNRAGNNRASFTRNNNGNGNVRRDSNAVDIMPVEGNLRSQGVLGRSPSSTQGTANRDSWASVESRDGAHRHLMNPLGYKKDVDCGLDESIFGSKGENKDVF